MEHCYGVWAVAQPRRLHVRCRCSCAAALKSRSPHVRWPAAAAATLPAMGHVGAAGCADCCLRPVSMCSSWLRVRRRVRLLPSRRLLPRL